MGYAVKRWMKAAKALPAGDLLAAAGKKHFTSGEASTHRPPCVVQA
jgi:hypothetical protein